MTTYAVSGPSPRLAMLRALFLKAAHRAGQILTTIKVALTRGTQLIRVGSSVALSLIGSETGFQVARHAIRTMVSTAAKVAMAGLRLMGRGLGVIGRLAQGAIAMVSPEAAKVIEQEIQHWIIEPVNRAFSTISAWVRSAAGLLWALTDFAVVKAVTVRSAQAGVLILSVNAISQGAVASRVVQAVPPLIDAVLWLTSPVKVLALVVAAFIAALGFAAFRLLDRTDNPNPDEPAQAAEPLLDPGTPVLVAELRKVAQPAYDLEKIAARVQVEVAADGSVLVSSIPGDLPEEVGLEVAHIAADAANARLQRILMHRPVLTRDDRRLLVKTAREALRAEGRRRGRMAG